MTRAAGGLVDIADVPSNSGWLPLPLQGGIVSNVTFPAEYLRMVIGGVVMVALRGRVTCNVGAGLTTAVAIAQMPADCLPSNQAELGIRPSSSTGTGRLWIDSLGMIRAQNFTAVTDTPVFLLNSYIATP